MVARSSTSSARTGGGTNGYYTVLIFSTIRDVHIALVTRLHNSIDDMPFKQTCLRLEGLHASERRKERAEVEVEAEAEVAVAEVVEAGSQKVETATKGDDFDSNIKQIKLLSSQSFLTWIAGEEVDIDTEGLLKEYEVQQKRETYKLQES